MSKSPSVRASLITKRTYNRPKADDTFESWDETVDRVVGHQRWLWEQAKHAKLNKAQVAELEELRQLMLERKALMSGRSLWLGGTEISRTRMSSMFNCSFTNVETVYDVVDCFWLLLQGCGVGFRPIRGTLNGFSNSIKDIQIVRSTRTDKGGTDKNIESYDRATKTWTIKIGDSAEAWAKSIGKLLAGKYPANTLILDFSALRPAGERLKGYGWISSGDEAIAKAYEKIAGIMSKRAGNLLSAIDILDIVNHLGTVLSSRRSAQICIMDADDFEANAFAIAKKDFWLHDNSHRCQSNNSLVFHKKPSIEQLSDLFALMERAGGSEPGFINAEAATKRAPWFSGVNPCCVTGDMLIQTKNGLRKAHSLLDNNYLAMVNGTAYKSETGFWETGTKEVYLITTDIGVKSKATIDHRFKLDNDTWSELGDINIGDKLQLSINSHEVKINKSDFDKGWLVGEIAGDGGYNPSKYPTYLGFWGESQREMSEIAINVINNLDVDYSRPVKLNFDKKIDCNGRLTITSKVMDKFCEKYLTEYDKDIKDDLFEESESFQLGFVRGLFDADGSVQGNLNKGVSIRLTQVNLNRLEIVQQILLSVGIVSKIYKNRMVQGERLLPDSDRELKSYPCKAVHELIISNESFSKFGKLIGFYEPAKQERFVNIENSRLRNPYCDKHIAKIISIESLGEQVVYDTNVSEISAFSSNGLIAHNCEILLGNKSFCNLTELDIGKFHGDTDGLNRALYIMGRANYRQTIVNLKDGILQEAWHLNNEFLRLCGVGLTGIARRPDLMAYDYQSMQRIATSATMGMADELGLQKPKNTTTVKPSGCRPWNALTTTEDGIFTLEELFVDHDESVEWDSFNSDLKVIQGDSNNAITKTYNNGEAEVFSVSMNHGLTVESTANHPWFVTSYYDSEKRKYTDINDWVETSNLKNGHIIDVKVGVYTKHEHQKLLKLNSLSLKMRGDVSVITQPDCMDNDLAWMLGYLWGDGAMSPLKYRLRWIDQNINNLEKVNKIIFDKFSVSGEIHRASQDRDAYVLEIGSKMLWHWLLKNNVFKYDVDKLELMPTCIRTSTHCDIISFIAGLVDSDGCIGIDSRTGKRNVMISSADGRFAKHVQDIGWAVGLAFSMSHNTLGYNHQARKSMYLATLSVHTTEAAFSVLAKNSTKIAKETRGSHWMYESTASNAGIIGKVRTVTSIGIKPTFDIEVANEHWYYAGSVKSHNTLSKIMDTTEGIHKPLGRYIFNNVVFSNHDENLQSLRDANYKIIPHPNDGTSCIVCFPVSWDDVPFDNWQGMEVNLESAITQLDRYALLQNNWTQQNTSVTISYSPEEVPDIIQWLLTNWDLYVGVSFLYRADPTKTAADLGYQYLPQEVVTKDVFDAYVSTLGEVVTSGSFTEIESQECVGGVCPVK